MSRKRRSISSRFASLTEKVTSWKSEGADRFSRMKLLAEDSPLEVSLNTWVGLTSFAACSLECKTVALMIDRSWEIMARAVAAL